MTDYTIDPGATIDRLIAERDAALAELADRKVKHLRSCQLAIGKSQLAKQRHAEALALQQRLTATDERADVLAGLLRDVSESVTGRQGTFARIPADWFDRRDAALKQAEGRGDA